MQNACLVISLNLCNINYVKLRLALCCRFSRFWQQSPNNHSYSKFHIWNFNLIEKYYSINEEVNNKKNKYKMYFILFYCVPSSVTYLRLCNRKKKKPLPSWINILVPTLMSHMISSMWISIPTWLTEKISILISA